MRTVLAALALSLVAGCAHEEWARPGFSAAENDRDTASCNRQADREYARAYTAERTQAYDGGLRAFDEPLGGIPRRYGRGDLVNQDDALRRLDRESLRSRTFAARERAFRDCLEAAGFRLVPKPSS
jgi:hypothetical protein